VFSRGKVQHDNEINGVKIELNGIKIELKTELVGLRTDLRGLKTDMVNLKTELKSDMANLKTELKSDMADLKTELKSDMADLKTELNASILSLKTGIEEKLGTHFSRVTTTNVHCCIVHGDLILPRRGKCRMVDDFLWNNSLDYWCQCCSRMFMRYSNRIAESSDNPDTMVLTAARFSSTTLAPISPTLERYMLLALLATSSASRHGDSRTQLASCSYCWCRCPPCSEQRHPRRS
jgi:hypothetical protein